MCVALILAVLLSIVPAGSLEVRADGAIRELAPYELGTLQCSNDEIRWISVTFTNVVNVADREITETRDDGSTRPRTVRHVYSNAPTTITIGTQWYSVYRDTGARVPVTTMGDFVRGDDFEVLTPYGVIWDSGYMAGEPIAPAGSTFVLGAGIYIVRTFFGDDYYFVLTVSNQQGTDPTTQDNLASASSWAREGIARAISLDLVPQGLQSNYTQATTRAEFAALAVTLYENQRGTITGRTTFIDTSDVNVQKAAYIGIVTGVGGNRFAPDDTITREQAAVMLARLADAIGQPLPQSAPTFADNAQLSSWARDGVGAAQASGLMGGVGNNMFSPRGLYTREQSIITILRLFDFLQ